MPPKTRGNKIMKASKENIGVNNRTKSKTINNVPRLPRKALADKTNSASDDNASLFQSKPGVNVIRNEDNLLNKQRPRRNRRLPSRYIENNGIQNLSKSKNTYIEKEIVSKPTPVKNDPIVVLSPLKTPKLNLDSSLTARRPKRICRLPSKFNDHSVSPSKFVPVQPAYASTPKSVYKPGKEVEKNDPYNKGTLKKTSDKVISNKLNKKKVIDGKTLNTTKTNSPNSSADTNNNAKTDQLPHRKTKNRQNTSPKSSTINPKVVSSKKLVNKNFSIRILEDKKKSLKRDASNFDVYEFTYDPNEEPPPQKKKRRKPTKKREPKPKSVVFKDNYDRNLAKTLRTLKNTISDKTSKSTVKPKTQTGATQMATAHPVPDILVTAINSPIPTNPCNSDKCYTSMKNYNSVRVEDIELDFETDNCVNDVNYSPVHSPYHETTPSTHDNQGQDKHLPTNDALNTPVNQNIMPVPAETNSNNDPLNLREELSFFDDPPVASSSMNVSTRNPAASPWRVEFGSLPIKWQVNTYVKPNMTPAFESSFMNFNDSKKKHVYTNIIPETNEENDVPQIYEDYSSKLKQTSILSFIKEVVEKNAKKKKEKMTPIKANSVFEDENDALVNKDAVLAQNDHVTPKKNAQVNVQATDQTPPQNVSNISHENADATNNPTENKKDSSKDSSKNSNKKKGDKNVTYFGFDDSEDQENVSPVKKLDKRKLRALKPRSRAVLQEINKQKGPTRALLPVAVKSKPVQSSEAANKLFDQMKSATEPPVFPDENPVQNTDTTNITEVQNNIETNDDDSVHLFEDIEVVHNTKAHRKSYGKAKKTVAFRQNSISDSDVPHSDVAEQSASSDEDDMHDLTFKVPAMEPKKAARKKKPKKPKISKKEEQEVEAWAAGFNSMCEDIEEFDLVVE